MIYTFYNPDTDLQESRSYNVEIEIDCTDEKLYLSLNDTSRVSSASVIKGSMLTTLPNGLSQDLDIKTLESSTTNMSFSAVNGILSNGEKLSQFLYRRLYNKLINTKVTISIIENNVAENLFMGFLTGFPSSDVFETNYTFDCEDITKLLKKSVYGEYFRVSPENTTIKYDEDLANKPSGSYGTILKFARKENSGVTGSISGIYNYSETTNSTTIKSWVDAGDEIWYVLSYTGKPINLAKDLIKKLGFESYYNSTAFDAVTADPKNQMVDTLYWEFKEGIENAWEFMLNECFFISSAFPYIQSDGKLSLKIIEQPTALETLVLFDENNIIEVQSNDNDIRNIVNNSVINFDYNFEEDKFISTVYEFDDDIYRDSINRFGMLPDNYSLEFKGLNKNSVMVSGNQKLDFISTLAAYMFNRLALTFKVISIKVLRAYAKDLIVGSYIQFAHNKMINWKEASAGIRGVTTFADDKYAIIDFSMWGDYTSLYETNQAFIDAQQITGAFWNYNWYVKKVENKATSIFDADTSQWQEQSTKDAADSYILPYSLSLPVQENLTVDKVIKIETFEDILLNYKLNNNFLHYHRRGV